MGWSLILSWDRCLVPRCEADFLGSGGVKSTGCCLQGYIHRSVKLKACFHQQQCSQDGFPSRDAEALRWAQGERLLPWDGEAVPSTRSLCPRERGRAPFYEELMKLCKGLAQSDKKNCLLLNSADSWRCFYFLGLNQCCFAESGSKSHIEIPQWILAIRNALIETLDTATAIKRNMPEIISLLQKLMSLLEKDTITSSCRYLHPASLNKLLHMGLVFQCGLLQSTGPTWFPSWDTILQSPGWHPGTCQLWREPCCRLPGHLHPPA